MGVVNRALTVVIKCLIFLGVFSNFTGISTTNSSLRQLHIVFRHGERAPTETYKNDPYKNFAWSGGWGELTNRGKLQMFFLGQILRELYPGFIPHYYFPQDVEVLSSYADRCIMSAQALSAGLFPPTDKQIWNKNLMWQPVPVKYLPRSQDTLVAMKAACKKYDQQLSEVMESKTIQSINKENAKLFNYLTQNTGQSIDTIGKVELLYNTLEIEKLHNLTLPFWTHNVSFPHLKELAARSLETFTETDYMKRMKGGVLLKKVIQNMESKDGPCLHLYAAHDLTLVNILKTLGYKALLKPGFGASFIIELHNNSKILMAYRDDVTSKAEPILVHNCSFCTLADFKYKIENFIPKDWDKECDRDKNKGHDLKKQSFVGFVYISSFLILLVWLQ